ncbi:Cnl2/NKP2 family protein-domain-containing protein [Talaromyces proteolyticus]|uniref:Cnl2/NKP2 family protein-domain-containing protein n=1 Tax=Talaromyces proteolyticus TaxID=1131652 RepID=A0AAD4KVK8_9EURO|nr:Cnl2/NKP2 family protein-domain-containing protein [Talaromyces proteolyticus]KAH8697686.1 Cnl2/NKP2 family protein-domain-containing protein [Talaromyces proteolyticus]
MAPSEDSILNNFLLSPASLPTIISLQKFTELFPKRLRSHPQIKVLYRELQELRSQDMDGVTEHILEQVEEGGKQRADLLRAAKASGVNGFSEDDRREMSLDLQLFGPTSSTEPVGFHSFSSLISEMENACSTLEQEIAATGQNAASTLADMKRTVGELSDLRYGKFSKPGMTVDDFVGETVRGLKSLQNVCDRQSDDRLS